MSATRSGGWRSVASEIAYSELRSFRERLERSRATTRIALSFAGIGLIAIVLFRLDNRIQITSGLMYLAAGILATFRMRHEETTLGYLADRFGDSLDIEERDDYARWLPGEFDGPKSRTLRRIIRNEFLLISVTFTYVAMVLSTLTVLRMGSEEEPKAASSPAWSKAEVVELLWPVDRSRYASWRESLQISPRIRDFAIGEYLLYYSPAGEPIDLRDIDLSQTIGLSSLSMQGALLNRANLSYASMTSSDLSGAYLVDANLQGGNLRGADLSKCDLSGANLSQCDLREADLRGATLHGADLSGANLSGANLSGAVGPPLRTSGLVINDGTLPPSPALPAWWPIE